MEFGMSCRIKPKRNIHVRISMKEIWRKLDCPTKNKELWSFVVKFECSRPKSSSVYLLTLSYQFYVERWSWLCDVMLTFRGNRSSDRSFMVDPLSYFSFQPVLHDWCNKGRGMCYHVCGMVHLKEPLVSIEKSSPCGGSGFPLSLWSFTICLTPYNHK